MTLAKLVLLVALVLVVPFGCLLALYWGRSRAAGLSSARDLRRKRLGTHLSDSLERQVVARETVSTEPLTPEQRLTFARRRAVLRAPETPHLGTCDGLCVGLGGNTKDVRRTRKGFYCAVCSRPVWTVDAEMRADESPALARVWERIKATLAEEERERADELTREAQETGQDYRPEAVDGGYYYLDSDGNVRHSGGVVRTDVTFTASAVDGPLTFTASNGTTSTTLTASAPEEPAQHPHLWRMVFVGKSLCAVAPDGRADVYLPSQVAWARLVEGEPLWHAAHKALGEST